ncbi:Alpha-L-rhamnosidase [Fusarium keratoplasticum]|uniref:Alpha-L-rhamnosidase n=1 Tax=Fusarium keratoplasticum TaxID=1328300 RepID=A0ACC0QK59_9HYPO|nr:Alpha-L-rhamnosidase [Fusarium keratoplasticum]KAI8657188.1 Alpha-L-rhamnosidase [Fusarium keratoplasticum]KAI8658164.1 Alpha-L-rhamnosidase [Fusarium keratoplasticum]
MSVSIAQLSAEHHHNGFGLFTATPRLSWRFNSTTIKGWKQASYDLAITRNGKEETYHVDSASSVYNPWPSSPLSSRERAGIKVRAVGVDASSTDWANLTIEAALLNRSDWTAKLIGGPPQGPEPKRPVLLRKTFTNPGSNCARLYATAHGVYEVHINGQRVSDELLAPGWQSYNHRLHYQTYDVTSLLQEGENVIGAHVAEGWFASRIGRPGVANHWGEQLGFLAQLEVDGSVCCQTDSSWEYLDGPLLLSELYNGEVFDSNLADLAWSTLASKAQAKGSVEELPFPKAELIAPEVAPITRIMELKPKEIITTPKGKKVLDFGQNFVGWLRVEKNIPGKPGDTLLIRHAEVMEHGELGTRPLRSAKALYELKLGGPTKGCEAKFTFFGFRYAEINGYEDVSLEDFTGIVIASNLRRTGTFESSHTMLNRLHENAIWSMRGNFISIPTDCPQRDEKLGWTGDIQVFSPTANFLFDTSAFLGSWLRDLDMDQNDANGVVPVIIPNLPKQPDNRMKRPMAVWGDTSVITPWDLYTAFGDISQLEAQWESMCSWLDVGVPRDERGFWSTDWPQYGDWLDPRAPVDMPGNCPTDNFLVANAYLIYTTKLAAEVGKVLGKNEKSVKYASDAASLILLFREEYVTPKGRMACDTQTTYALALKFGLLEEKHLATARERLGYLVRWERFKITTGFAGTPIILHALSENGMLNLAYRMLQERDCPSWLYPVGMGATSIWERWNSMLEDGSINPGQMTSFNHYALGSVCAFMHKTVGGLSPTSPGWKTALVKPQPGGTIRFAKTSFDSPYGLYEVDWKIEGGKMTTKAKIPPNTEARVVLNGVDETVGSGEYEYVTEWNDDAEWPPNYISGPQRNTVGASFVP